MHLFAGVGGGLLADLILGHRSICAVEWDKYACQVLRERAADGWFPDLRVWEGDVRLFDPSEYTGRVGCIHAGFPCQDLSVAGKQAGLGEGTRSGLYREVLRIAGVVRPKYLFLENVAAILYNGLGTVLGDLAALGYDTRWLCIRASDVGAPHHRDRWFALCHAKYVGRDAAEVAGSVTSGSDDNEARPQQAKQLTRPSDTKILAYTNGAPSERTQQPKRSEPINAVNIINDWWEVESRVDRVVDGIPHRVHRLKGLGNAQVPIQAATAWRLLGGC
jgi:DNA (cytosine-5)-methyltransferase 1